MVVTVYPPCIHHVSTLYPPCIRPVSTLYPPCIHHVSASQARRALSIANFAAADTPARSLIARFSYSIILKDSG